METIHDKRPTISSTKRIFIARNPEGYVRTDVTRVLARSRQGVFAQLFRKKRPTYNNIIYKYYYMARPRSGYKPKAKSTYYSKFKRGVSLAAKVAQTAATVAKIASMVNSEKQYYDNNTLLVTRNPTPTGTVDIMSGIPQGDDNGQRTGNSIKLNSLYITMQGGMSASATQTFVRMILFEDKFNTGTAPTAANVLGLTLTTGWSVIAPLNVDFSTRYKVLLDKRIALSQNGKQNFIFKKYIKTQRHVHYTGPAATDTYNGNIYLLLLSNESTNTPTIYFNCRVGYYDN